MAGDILGISVSGAMAAQRALATTGHNIANANTEGYSVQRVDLTARPPQLFSNGAIGTGVNVDNVRRMYDDFVANEVKDNTSAYNSLDTNYKYTSQIDDILADPKSGLSSSLSTFFSAVNGMANDPNSASARQVMLSEANSMADRFTYLDNRFNTLRQGVNQETRSVVDEISELASSIAKLNDTIVKAREIGGTTPNDLLDQRDRLVLHLSELVSVRTSVQEDGRMNVFIGNGQSLVVGSQAAELSVESSRFDPNEIEIVFVKNGATSIVTRFLTGGQLGGLLDFKKGVLDTAQNELGRIAIGIAETFNAQHRMGMDQQSRYGNDFFNDAGLLAPKVLPDMDNAGDMILSAEITDSNKLTTSDYTLNYNAGTYTLVRLSDDKLIGSYTSLPIDAVDDGFRITLDSGTVINDGDSFMIRPTRAGSENFSTVIEDVQRIAASGPLRTEANIENQGSGAISPATVVDIDNPVFDKPSNSLSPPFIIHFISETQFEVLDNTGEPIQFKLAATPADPVIQDDGTGSPALVPKPPFPALPPMTAVLDYNPDTGTDVFPTPGGDDFGFRVRLTGEPVAGDTFKIEFNANGTGDNLNALKLAELQTAKVLAEQTTSYTEAYSRLVSRVGSKTHELDINGKSQQLLLDQSVAREEQISGVNLDEEAANLMRYQNLYQANAQVISVANKMLETLMNSFR